MTAIPPNLDVAGSKPRTNASLLEPHTDHISGRLYDLVDLVLSEWYSGHDFNTRRAVVGNLNAYLSAAQHVFPGQQTLRIPRRLANDIVERLYLRKGSTPGDGSPERKSVSLILQSVRRFYELAQATVAEFDDFADLVGPFPVSRETVSALSKKYNKNARSRMHAEIRDRITSLDDLTPAAYEMARFAKEVLAVARDTKPGEHFTYAGVEYRRIEVRHHQASRGAFLRVVRADGTRGWTDLVERAHRAVRVKALVVVLRHTGIRREEAMEVTQGDLGFAMIDGSEVPSLHVGPAKTDTSRTIAMHREVIEAFVELIDSYHDLYGEVPLAVRRDKQERRVLAPGRYLFQNHRLGSFTTPDDSTLAEWVTTFIADYNAMLDARDDHPLKPLRMHDFRRLFATDLLDKDVPLASVRQLLGHTNLATTAIYDHTTWDRAAAQFLDSHRAAAVQAAPHTKCPHCGGTGRV